MEPASNSASSKQRKVSLGPQQEWFHGSALREELKKAEPGTQDLEPSVQESGKKTDGGRSDREAKMMTDEQISAVVKKNDGATVKKESNADQQERLVVKLKHKGDKTGGLAPGSQLPASASSGDSNQPLSPGKAPDTIVVKIPIKQEPGEDGEASHQKSDSSGPKTDNGNGGDSHASARQLLNEFTREAARNEVTEHDSETEGLQRIDRSGSAQEGSGGGDGSQSNRATSLPDNHEASHRLPGLDVARLDRDKETQPTSLEQDRIHNVKDEHQSGGDVSTQTVADSISVPEEHERVDDDIGDWMPGDGEDMQEFPRPDKAGAPWNEHDRLGIAKGAARSDLKTAKLEEASMAAAPLSQHHQVFTDPVHFTNKSYSPHLSYEHGVMQYMAASGFEHHGSSTSRHGSQQPITQHRLPYLTPDLERQMQLLSQIEQKKRQLENARRLHEQSQDQARRVSSSYGLTQSLSGTPPPFPVGPLSYPRAPPSGYQQPVSGYNNASYQFQMQAPAPCGGMGSSLSPASLLTPDYNLQSHRLIAAGLNRRLPGPYAPRAPPASQLQVLDENDCDEDECEGISDDDEPLRTRVKRHPSITSQEPAISLSPPPRPSARGARPTQREDSSDIEFFSNNPKAKPPADKNPLRLARPLSQPHPASSPPPTTTTTTTDPTAIDWKLPRFDLQCQPPEKGSDIPVVKISLPNLVREELLLSPDHSAQEIHLLLNVFLPSQRALATPDPEPAAAVLNFHTIALMVIEAFVQYEIGDEMGTGRGHWHSAHDQGGEEYVRVRSTRDANVDEIFFAVVDRWRAGVESKKKSLEVIRGAQEFCDVALDVIYWVKENGLLGPGDDGQCGEKGKGKGKGKKRSRPAATAAVAAGQEDGGDEDEGDDAAVPEGVSKGKLTAKTKRGTADKPNQVKPRKKAKTQATEVKKKKRTPQTPGITITKRR